MIARKDAWKFLKFAMVGLASTMIYFLLLAVMSEFIANILILTAVCYALSMLLNYLMQSLYTFRAGAPVAPRGVAIRDDACMRAGFQFAGDEDDGRHPVRPTDPVADPGDGHAGGLHVPYFKAVGVWLRGWRQKRADRGGLPAAYLRRGL
jgi:hypothetical protein